MPIPCFLFNWDEKSSCVQNDHPKFGLRERVGVDSVPLQRSYMEQLKKKIGLGAIEQMCFFSLLTIKKNSQVLIKLQSLVSLQWVKFGIKAA